MRKRSRKSRKTVNKPASEKSATRSHGEIQPTKPGERVPASKPHERLIEKVRRHTITDPSLLELQRLLRGWRIRNASPDSFLGRLRDVKKRGKPRDIEKWEIWVKGAQLRTEQPRNWSWDKLTRSLDPDGYAADAQRATDRMRQGIEYVLEKMPKPN